MKKQNKTKGYEVVPVRLSIPLMPEPILPTGSRSNLKNATFQQASSFQTSIQSAEAFTREKIKQCRNAIKARNFDGFNRIISSLPALQDSLAVQEMLHRYEKRIHGSRGRPAGRYTYNPTVIAGLVNQAIATGKAKNREQAFLVAGQLLGLSYDVVKRYFYNAMSVAEFQPTFIETGEARIATAEDMQKLALARSIFQ